MLAAPYPFSFLYAGKPAGGLLDGWHLRREDCELESDRTRSHWVWTDPETGLAASWESVTYTDFPAVEWLLSFENTGGHDTPIIEDVLALDWTLDDPRADGHPYLLHRTNGAPVNPTDFEPSVLPISAAESVTTGGGGGRSSNKDFPFFRVDTGSGALIAAVGWSGQWQATVEAPGGHALHVTAGLEQTHFRLHPGERVRSPRILLLFWEGDALEANARFRELIYKHYAAKWRPPGRQGLPVLFCNTCFTRGGGWLNECDEANQISLIKSFRPLGLEAVITDAGWFEGGWPAGAGNWTARKDAYPDGMAPVAQAAKDNRMVYGLWFEPERVVAGTDLEKHHPEWLLRAGDGPQDTYLLDFGLPEARDYFIGILKEFMEMPGFRVYRQDFNIDPLPFWRHTDAPDRQGISEMMYIEGLYAYWDRISQTWPDVLMEGCTSGGKRIDLETIMRLPMHQKSDYWFDNETDQSALWGLSQYLPNSCFVAHLNRMDDYSFHSTLASSLCLGWITDAPEFDAERGKQICERYRQVRPYLVGAWYPLLPCSRDPKDWMACQFHRRDLNEGMILAFRHAESPDASMGVALHGLDREARYELRSDRMGETTFAAGAYLMREIALSLPEPGTSDLIVYSRAAG